MEEESVVVTARDEGGEVGTCFRGVGGIELDCYCALCLVSNAEEREKEACHSGLESDVGCHFALRQRL